MALDELHRHEEAIACYHKAIQIDPENVNALFNKGNALKFLGKVEEAQQCLDKVKELEEKE